LRGRIATALKRPLGRYWWEASLQSALSLVQLLALTRKRSAQLRLVVAWLGLTLKETADILPKARFRVTFDYDGHQVSPLVWDRSELDVITEVFVLRHYELAADSDAKVIVDVGSNIGLSVLYFHICCPDALIVAVEADPETFRRLELNTKPLSRVRLVNVAVAGKTGTVDLYSGAHSWEASLYPKAGLHRPRRVPARTLDDLLRSIGVSDVDIVKLDIEGAETEVLPRSSAIQSARVIAFEYHAEYAKLTLFELLAALPSFALERFQGNSQYHALVTLRRH
jgi:FkbM family methyltransferase